MTKTKSRTLAVVDDLLLLLIPMLLGFVLWCLLSGCVSTEAEAQRVRGEVARAATDVAPFLPPPFNYAAELGGLALASYVTYKGGAHVAKRRAAKKAAAKVA